MFGLELYELLSFGRQLGLSVAGAACFWGMIFIFKSRKKSTTEISSIILEWISRRFMWLLYGGGLLSLVCWFLIAQMNVAQAHEGVTLISTFDQMVTAAKQLTPLYIAWCATLIIGLVLKNTKYLVIRRGLSLFYLINFIFTFILISYYTTLADFSLKESIFHIFHGFHSIFTLGTVLLLDFMFLSSQSSTVLQQHIFPLFPKISKVIWIGLSLDLASVLLIFPEAIILSPRFYFAQTVVALLIINGVLLSGILTRRILALLHAGKHEESKRWEIFAGISGAISVTSWVAITFVDFFPQIEFSYLELIGLYFFVIAFLFITHMIWEALDKEEPEYSR